MKTVVILDSVIVPGDFRYLYGRVPFGLLRLHETDVIRSVVDELEGEYDKYYVTTLPLFNYHLRENISPIVINEKVPLERLIEQVISEIREKHEISELTLRYSSTFRIEGFKRGNKDYIVTTKGAATLLESLGSGERIVGEFKISNWELFVKLLRENCSIEKTLDNYYQNSDQIISLPEENFTYLGTLNNFLVEKINYSESRNFNSLSLRENWFIKSSNDQVKIGGEFFWLDRMREHLPLNIPSVKSLRNCGDQAEYWIEIKYAPTLQELMLSEHQSKGFKLDLLKKLLKFHKTINLSSTEQKGFTRELGAKLAKRINENKEFYSENFPSVDSVINDHEDLLSIISNIKSIDSFGTIHGDFCFSNILYETPYDKFILIDPRGLDFSGNPSTKGWIYYDVAKVAHSIFGYDQIIVNGSWSENLLKDEANINVIASQYSLTRVEILALAGHLFISLLPLHQDRPDRIILFKLVWLKILNEIKLC